MKPSFHIFSHYEPIMYTYAFICNKLPKKGKQTRKKIHFHSPSLLSVSPTITNTKTIHNLCSLSIFCYTENNNKKSRFHKVSGFGSKPKKISCLPFKYYTLSHFFKSLPAQAKRCIQHPPNPYKTQDVLIYKYQYHVFLYPSS